MKTAKFRTRVHLVNETSTERQRY